MFAWFAQEPTSGRHELRQRHCCLMTACFFCYLAALAVMQNAYSINVSTEKNTCEYKAAETSNNIVAYHAVKKNRNVAIFGNGQGVTSLSAAQCERDGPGDAGER